jgi:hypothetical protein
MKGLVNKSFSWFFQRRYKYVEKYLNNPHRIQAVELQNLLQAAKNTVYGKKYHFASIKDYNHFSERLPVCDYEDLKPYIRRMMLGERDVLWPGIIEWYSKSSGTTSDKSKYIPVTPKNLKHCHIKGGWDSMTFLYHQHPDLKIFGSKNLVMGGSIAPYHENPKTKIGDVSAIMLNHLPFYTRPFYTPDFETALSPNMEEKINKMAQIVPQEDVTMIGGVPTWVVVLFRKILEQTGKDNILEVWPNLKVYMHGGVSFKPYREQFRQFLPREDFIYQEIYNASEGFFAAQDDMDEDGMALFLDNGMYFEFIPSGEWEKEKPMPIPLEAVEEGKNYAIVISTNSGLWRYVPGDTVMFTSTKPYRIKVTGRTKHFINAFGEEVMVENTDAALAATCRETGAIATEYTVCPVYFNNGSKGGHEWLIEFEKEPSNLESFSIILDNNLKKLNSDYEAKRYKDMALERLQIQILPKGTFFQWLRSKGKFGGQHKIPRLSNHREYVEEILKFRESERI